MWSVVNSAQIALTSARTQPISRLNSESASVPMFPPFYGFACSVTVTSGELSAQVNSGALSI